MKHAKKQKEQIELSDNDKMMVNRFESLRRVQVKKRRSCVSCQKEFVSSSSGHRVCHVCAGIIGRKGAMAENIIVDR